MFEGSLMVEQLTESAGDANATWRVLSRFGFLSAGTGHGIFAEVGFVTDFASVPRIPIAFEIDGDIAQDCAALHDVMYQQAEIPRDVCDKILVEMMRVRGFNELRCQTIYDAVRLFGASHYGVKKS